jgi:hypothetical protein
VGRERPWGRDGHVNQHRVNELLQDRFAVLAETETNDWRVVAVWAPCARHVSL